MSRHTGLPVTELNSVVPVNGLKVCLIIAVVLLSKSDDKVYNLRSKQ